MTDRPADDDAVRGARRQAADAWTAQMDALGEFIRAQRQLAKLSLREMASMTSVSNAYLSQIERGLHQPSLKVLRSIADALNLSTEQMLAQAGWARSTDGGSGVDANGASAQPGAAEHDTEECIRRDPRLSATQREALISVYRSFVAGAS
jgi:transcriptional regulator with XRE-family HTH domain